MGNIGAPELIVVLIIVLLLFGGKKIPELAKSLGKGISEFKNASKEVPTDKEKSDKDNGPKKEG